MNVSLWFGGATLYLNGGATPVKGAKGPVVGVESLEIELTLEGTVAAINTWLYTLERMLLDAGPNYAIPGIDPVWVKVVEDSVTWRSPVKAGVMEFLKSIGSRVVGSQGIKVTLERGGYWEKETAVSLPLTNSNGSLVTTGLAVDNHTDAGPHENYVDIPASYVLGSYDAPAILTLTRTGTDGMELCLGMARKVASWDATIESSAGVAGAGVVSTLAASAACSGGSYQNLAWNGAGAVTLLSFTRTAAWTKNAMGLYYRPAVRLANLITAGERIWCWWRASYDNGATIETINESEPVLLSTSELWGVFPALRVPPWPVGDLTPASEAVCLQLMAQAEAAGAHVVDLDFAQILPTEGWLRYVPLISNIADTKIYHDSGQGIIRRSTTLMQTHFIEGGSMLLRPLAAHRIYVLAKAGATMAIDWETTIKVEYRERRVWL